MRIAINGPGLLMIGFMVGLAGCGRDMEYEDYVETYSTVMPCSVLQLTDNGFVSDYIVPVDYEKYPFGS